MRETGTWWARRCGPGAYRMRPYGGERRRVRVGADYISARAHRRVGCTFAERTHRRGAHRASVAGYDLRSAGGRGTWSRRHGGMPPYARSGRRTALHTGTKRTRHARPYGERNHRTPVRSGTWFRAAIKAAPTFRIGGGFGGGCFTGPGRRPGGRSCRRGSRLRRRSAPRGRGSPR